MSTSTKKNKYVYNPIINKKFEGHSAVDAILNINKKSIKEEIGELDDNLIDLKSSLKKIQKDTIKDIIFSGQRVPKTWKSKLNFRDFVKNVIGHDHHIPKYILENQLLDEKERELNVNIRTIIKNSPVIQKIRPTQHLSLLKRFIKEKYTKSDSTDSSEEKTVRKNVDKIHLHPTSNTERTKNYNQDLKFTFSPIKSLPYSQIYGNELEKKDSNNEFFKMKEDLFSNVKDNQDTSFNLNSNINSPIYSKFNSVNLKRNINPFIIDKNKDLPLINKLTNKSSLSNVQNLDVIHNEEEELKISKSYNNLNKIEISDTYDGKARNSSNLAKKMKKITNSAEEITENLSPKGQNVTNEKNKSKIKNNYSFNSLFINEKKFNDFSCTNVNSNLNYSKGDAGIYYQVFSPEKLSDTSGAEEKKNQYEFQKQKRIEEFKRLRNKKLNYSILSSHSIIDYSFNKSDHLPMREYLNKSGAINIISKEEKERNNILNEKIKIKNEKIKDLIHKTKSKGHFGPYFSLCRNCNQRNNDFYEKINCSHAVKLLNLINKQDK